MKNEEINNNFAFSTANFIVIEDSIYKDLRLTANDILIYGLINSLSNNDEKKCFAQNKFLAQNRNLSIRQVQKSIRKLKLLNYIIVDYDDENKNVRYIRTFINQKIVERDQSNNENQVSIDDLEDYNWLEDKDV